MPLLSVEMDNLDLKTWSANAGITCLVCHRITEVHGPNGDYVVDEPILYPFTLANDPKLQKAHKIMLDYTPWLHTKVLSKPFYSTSEYCASCHTLVVPQAINGSTGLVLQNEYGEWHSNHYANYDNCQKYMQTKTCSDFHMPLVPLKQFHSKIIFNSVLQE